MAKPDASPLGPNFDAEGFERFRSAVLSRFVAVESGRGPRFGELDPDEAEARVEAALRARARWADEGDFSLALVDPAEAVDGKGDE